MILKKLMLIAFVLIGISVIGNITLYALGYSPFNLATIDEKQSISSKDVTKISISSTSGDIKVIPSNKEQIQVEMVGEVKKNTKNDYSLSIENDGDEIHVVAKQEEKARLFVLKPGTYELLIKVPRRNFETVRVHSDTANLYLSDIEANNFELKALAGKITVNQLKGRIDAETTVGDINLTLSNILFDVVAKSINGSITLKTQKVPEAFQTDLRTSFGDKVVDLPNTANGSVGGSGPFVKLSSIDGDLAILKSNK